MLAAHLVFLLPFFFNDTAPTEIYTLSLHDALPIFIPERRLRLTTSAEACLAVAPSASVASRRLREPSTSSARDRKSTRLNSSHVEISYAVFCLKKKKKTQHSPSSTPSPQKSLQRVR